MFFSIFLISAFCELIYIPFKLEIVEQSVLFCCTGQAETKVPQCTQWGELHCLPTPLSKPSNTRPQVTPTCLVDRLWPVTVKSAAEDVQQELFSKAEWICTAATPIFTTTRLVWRAGHVIGARLYGGHWWWFLGIGKTQETDWCEVSLCHST